MSEDEIRVPLSTIEAAHGRIDAWFESTREALTGEQPLSACEQLRDVLEAHFAQEEKLYFPTLWQLRPDYEQRFRGLISAHAIFLDKIDEAVEFIRADQPSEAVRCFEDLRRLFAAHEVEEEETLRSLA